MEFWQAFNQESLENPWVIQGEGGVPAAHPWAQWSHFFFVEPGASDEAFAMMDKMIAAIDLPADQVLCHELDRAQVDQLQQLGSSKKILFFGSNFPGQFGLQENWYGHKTIQTHSIADLLQTPDLKRETWQHLKAFGGLQ